jgi:PAS domain-containing protein
MGVADSSFARPGGIPTRAWARLVWNPKTGVSEASGECQRLLGVAARALVESPDPLRLLPHGLTKTLVSGEIDSPMLVGSGSLLGMVVPVGGAFEITLFEFLETAPGGSSMVEELGTGVIGADRSGTIRYWNRAMSEIFPIPPETATGKQLEGVLPPPILFSWSGVIGSVLEGRQVRTEIRPGPQRRIEAVFTTGGPGITGVFLDTSDGFEAERRLRSARRMNQTYFQNISTGLVLMGSDYRVLVSNKAFGAMFGVVEGLPANPVYEVIPAECFAAMDDAVRRLRAGESEVPPALVSYRLGGGVQRVVSQSMRLIRSEDEQSTQLVGIFEDCTEVSLLQARNRSLTELLEKAAVLSAEVFQSRFPGACQETAEKLLASLGAEASAVYVQGETGSPRLGGQAGAWSGLPVDFADLKLPRTVWSSDGMTLPTPEPDGGTLLVVPVGSGRLNRGFILLRFGSGADASSVLPAARMAATAMRSSQETTSLVSQVEQMMFVLEKEKRFRKAVLTEIALPVAVFGEDWRVLGWNPAMARLTGMDQDSAGKRAGAVQEMLFGLAGGIAEVRRLSRRSVPDCATWPVRTADGTEVMMTWKLFRAESLETGNLEVLTVLAACGPEPAAPPPAGDSPPAAAGDLAARMPPSADLRQFATVLAETVAREPGATGCTVRIDTLPRPLEVRRGTGVGEPARRIIGEGTGILGSIEAWGVGDASLDRLAEASSQILRRVARSICTNLRDVSRGGTLIALTDAEGVLTAPAVLPGGPADAGSDLPEVLGLDAGAARAALKSVSSGAGRSRLPGIDLIAVHGCPPGEEAVVWVLRPGAGHELPEWLRLFDALSSWLPSKTDDVRGSFAAITRLLASDDPVRPILATATLDMTAAGRIGRMLEHLVRAVTRTPVPVPSGEIAAETVRLIASRGMRPPDLLLEGEPGTVLADPAEMPEILCSLCLSAGRGVSPSIVSGRPQSAAPVDGFHPFAMRWSFDIPEIPPTGRVIEWARAGRLGPDSETRMLATALELFGCIFSAGGREMTVLVPLARMSARTSWRMQ